MSNPKLQICRCLALTPFTWIWPPGSPEVAHLLHLNLPWISSPPVYQLHPPQGAEWVCLLYTICHCAKKCCIAQTASWSTCWVMGTWSPHPFKSCDRNRIKTNLVTPSLVSTPQLDLFTFVNLGMFYKTQHIPHCTVRAWLVDRLKTRDWE